MTTTTPDDVLVGTIDGAHLKVAPRYAGALSERERLRLIARAARAATAALDGNGADTAHPADVGAFRLHFTDLAYLTMNLGFIPADMPETVCAVGAALGIDHAEIERLVAELGECVHRYRLATRLVPGGAWLFDDEEPNRPREVAWRT